MIILYRIKFIKLITIIRLHRPLMSAVVKSSELMNDVMLVTMVTTAAECYIGTLFTYPQHSIYLRFFTVRVRTEFIMLNS